MKGEKVQPAVPPQLWTVNLTCTPYCPVGSYCSLGILMINHKCIVAT